MIKARILWIEGKRAESPSFIPSLRKKGYSVETVATGSEALARLHEMSPDLVVINAASLRTNGKRICRSIRDEVNGLPILLIANADKPSASDGCANTVLTLPFTTRKLVNGIKPLLPGGGEMVVRAGEITLDLERRQVRRQDREVRLTPRLVSLLRILMERPGEVIEREYLFTQVWKTAYTGDTRTLDVHISWLRQALEEDPHRPMFIKTIRGVGYRLDAV